MVKIAKKQLRAKHLSVLRCGWEGQVCVGEQEGREECWGLGEPGTREVGGHVWSMSSVTHGHP